MLTFAAEFLENFNLLPSSPTTHLQMLHQLLASPMALPLPPSSPSPPNTSVPFPQIHLPLNSLPGRSPSPRPGPAITHRVHYILRCTLRMDRLQTEGKGGVRPQDRHPQTSSLSKAGGHAGRMLSGHDATPRWNLAVPTWGGTVWKIKSFSSAL